MNLAYVIYMLGVPIKLVQKYRKKKIKIAYRYRRGPIYLVVASRLALRMSIEPVAAVNVV